jgi:hypothetical protein
VTERFTFQTLLVQTFGLFLTFVLGAPSFALAQANLQGQWQVLSYVMPINPIHLALMNNGEVLIISGSGNDRTETHFQAAVWNPANGAITTQQLGWDMFCNGMINLWNGQELIAGGTLQYGPFLGSPKASIYDPPSSTYRDLPNMADGRWYPTLTELSDGSVMVFSGISETGPTNSTVEIYNLNGGWSQPYMASWVPPLYPRMHLLPNGNVFYSGSTSSSRYYYPATNTWSNVTAVTNQSSLRTYGSSVLLPLTPANHYDPRVMILGGGSPTATSSTEVIDLGAANPAWQWGPPMSQARVEMAALMLPNGMLLALNGSAIDEDTTTASFNADLIDPIAMTVTSAGQEAYPRVYHSGALLLPNATVAAIGGNPRQGSYEPHVEIYSPPYLFNADGSAAYQPQISSITPSQIDYGAPFQVKTPDAASIVSVVLIPPGTPTHSFDNSAREVGMSFTPGDGVLNVIGPPNSSIAPPGYYMLFLVNSAGVPSVATFVDVPLPKATPTATPSPSPTPVSGLSVEPSSLNFGAIFVGSSGRSQPVTITNTSSKAVTVSRITTSNLGAVQFSNQCPAVLSANTSCAINVTFAPQHPGPRTESITVADNAANSPQVVSITGTGLMPPTPTATLTAKPTPTPTPAPVLQVAPSTLSFGTVIVGSSSAPQSLTLSNGSSAVLTISRLTTSNVGAIHLSSQCPAVLQANTSCVVTTTFAPQHPGPRSESLTITDSAANSPQIISITGTGVMPPTPIATQTATLTATPIPTATAATSP